MKYKWFRHIPSCLCFACAGVLAFYGKEGWSWFLFVGLLID